MTESREVLIDAMLREWYPPAVDDMAAREDAMGRMALMDMSRLLDTLLAHPSAVLAALENAPCQTCGGDKFMRDAYGRPTEDDCSACGGSGKLGRDGVLRALGMEQVGWTSDCRDGDFDFYEWTFETRRRRPRGGRWVPAFASRAAVSDTKEWEK